MLTKEERREKARKHFVSTFGEAEGTKMWQEYCEKSDLLPKEPKAQKAKGSKNDG